MGVKTGSLSSPCLCLAFRPHDYFPLPRIVASGLHPLRCTSDECPKLLTHSPGQVTWFHLVPVADVLAPAFCTLPPLPSTHPCGRPPLGSRARPHTLSPFSPLRLLLHLGNHDSTTRVLSDHLFLHVSLELSGTAPATHLALLGASDVTGSASVGELLRGLLGRLGSVSALLVRGSVEATVSAVFAARLQRSQTLTR